MSEFLKKIEKRKFEEICKLKEKRTSFAESIRSQRFSVIAEIKRRSPSKGAIGDIKDPLQLAQAYAQGGACGLSILTDEEGFGGTLADLRKVAINLPKLPLLRKDFILDPFQLQEAVVSGASCVLLIVSLLKERTADFYKAAKAMGLEALVEVHDEEELRMALSFGAELIGVNNRNLHTFEVDLAVCEKLSALIPARVIKVAESGIHTAEDAARMRNAGFHAILVGEALVKSQDPRQLIQEFRGLK